MTLPTGIVTAVRNRPWQAAACVALAATAAAALYVGGRIVYPTAPYPSLVRPETPVQAGIAVPVELPRRPHDGRPLTSEYADDGTVRYWRDGCVRPDDLAWITVTNDPPVALPDLTGDGAPELPGAYSCRFPYGPRDLDAIAAELDVLPPDVHYLYAPHTGDSL